MKWMIFWEKCVFKVCVSFVRSFILRDFWRYLAVLPWPGTNIPHSLARTQGQIRGAHYGNQHRTQSTLQICFTPTQTALFLLWLQPKDGWAAFLHTPEIVSLELEWCGSHLETDDFRYLTQLALCSICLLATGLFHLTESPQGSPKLSRVEGLPSFLRLKSIPLYV